MNEASGELSNHLTDRQAKSHPDDDVAVVFNPSRWWFASSLFPLISGTLGPVASAFSICALVRPWRQHFPPGTDIRQAAYIADPPWLIVLNALQLALALVSNLFLSLDMARRVRFTVAQPITIVGWYISALCLVALLASVREPAADVVWSQAFFYGIFAALLYFVVASLMVVTFVGAQMGHYKKDFDLSDSQRTLMLQTIAFLVYLLIGALVFCNIEGWSYLDAVYWANVTLYTIGFGDIVPQTPAGRGLLIPYALVGIISLGLVIGSIRLMVLERGRHRMDARIVEKKRRRKIRTIGARDDAHNILVPIRDNASESPPPDSAVPTSAAELERREKEFRLMRKIQHEAARRRRWTAMGVSASTWLVLWMVGARILQVCEEPYQQWNYFDGFYFGFVTLTTIGYGDRTPQSNAGKAFFVFWALLALPTTTVLISNAGETVVKLVKDATDHLGRITILPGEHGITKDAKDLARSMSCGFLFRDNVSETAPGIFAAAAPQQEEDDEEDDEVLGVGNDDDGGDRSVATRDDKFVHETAAHHEEKASESAARRRSNDDERDSKRSALEKPSTLNASAPPPAVEDSPLKLPSSPEEYHVALIREIGRVAGDLKEHPPKKYSFRDWAWFLRLIGEDESSAETHRQALLHRHHKRTGLGGHAKDESTDDTSAADPSTDSSIQWSWVGTRSPLMGTMDEAEWILHKLVGKLQEELARERDGNAERNKSTADTAENGGLGIAG